MTVLAEMPRPFDLDQMQVQELISPPILVENLTQTLSKTPLVCDFLADAFRKNSRGAITVKLSARVLRSFAALFGFRLESSQAMHSIWEELSDRLAKLDR